MAFASLKDVYIDQLQDLYSANKQARLATQKLAAAASDDTLQKALEAGVIGIENGMSALDAIIRGHGATPSAEFCKGMEGIVKEAQAHALDADFTNDEVQDAVIITQYQRMVHYALAGYGCVSAFAKRLDLGEEAKTIDKCLNETYEGDRTMTDLATNGINKQAA
ncbi:Protein yciF [Candidatus Phaeomarinobacter ectocarpi]|uniref:Protein yciF n=1 Tax=Candidatus Phaeomarinibacter ectocarpi TaxID=1458461 RepID=X5MM24_9HYPH|nr:DUF892 family protein [Candidatus Phaeomarinobacter ectocarpi]CDO58891.1 Protein yciF [Candidatus Phaeomarinobacter ectocarpi]